jgi:hypothetical protein
MTEQELRDRATRFLERTLKDAPKDHRTIALDGDEGYAPDVKRRIFDQTFSVLGPGPSITVFFDSKGAIQGWRDDGRKGTSVAIPPHREALLAAVVKELDLPKESWLGEVKPVILPPTGWTQQAVVFTSKIPKEDEVLRVWVEPLNWRIIQCLYGAAK